MKLNKSIGRVILSRGALLLALAIFGIQPLAAREEVPGSTAKSNIVETAIAAGQFKT